ncbi:hypothetical protein RJ639_007327 [Escallonia herrerae]|uniref:Retrotransposon gag domain-containing protein n=1 Tax=Escallonia herrerae TaxID=1293975 RepID=A0AA89AZF6_9ASTE|nr:hypothetical protein RJ639_007327 [Escallonia herrerae]
MTTFLTIRDDDMDTIMVLIVGICWRTLLASGKSSATHSFLRAIKGHRVSGGIRAAVAQGTVASAKKILWDSLLSKIMANTKERIDALEAQIRDMIKSDPDAPGILKQFSLRLDTLEVNLEATDNSRYAENMEWEGSRAVVNIPAGGVEHSLRPRVPEPKSYGGARDAKEVENFLFDIEQYFRAIRVDSKATKVSMATMYLVGDAKLWWRKKYAEIEDGSCVINTWDILKRELKSQFFPENIAFNARKALLECKHTGLVREYCQAFSALMLDISDMSAVGNPEENLTEEKPKDMPPKKKSDVPRKGLMYVDIKVNGKAIRAMVDT